MNFQEWLEQKFTEWEQTKPTRQSYYNFARYLDVSHTDMTQWISGVSQPSGDDLAKLAAKLGTEIYTILGKASSIFPEPVKEPFMAKIPSAIRQRLNNAIVETEREIVQRELPSESSEAKILAVKIFEKWGFRISS